MNEGKKAWFCMQGADVDDFPAEEVQELFKDLVQKWFKEKEK